MYRNTYALIDADAIKDNVKNIIENYPDYEYYFGIVKANGYGHTFAIANKMKEAGVNYFGVATLDEGVSLRNFTDLPILVLEPVPLKFVNVCQDKNITVTVHDLEYGRQLLDMQLAKELKVHLKVDSGMNRLGIKDKNQLKVIFDLFRKKENLKLEGLFTHFGTSGVYDSIYDKALTNFAEITSLIDLKEIPIVHLNRSITMTTHSKLEFANGTRFGILSFGIDPTPMPKTGLRKIKAEYFMKKNNVSPFTLTRKLTLKPALTLFSEVMQVKEVKAGEFVGYGSAFQAKEDIYVAVLPIGYADGLSPKNTGREIIINKNRYKIIGTICMDMTLVQVDGSVKAGDMATLIGEEITYREISRKTGQSSYQIMTGLTCRVPRLIKENGEIKADEF